MKKQHFIVLAVLVVALVAARYLVSHHGHGVARSLDDAGVGRVVAPEVDPATIKWIRISGAAPVAEPSAAEPKEGEAKPVEAGKTPEEAASKPAAGEPPTTAPATPPLELVRGGDGWTVTTQYGAKAEADQVDEFVRKALNETGEIRGQGATSFPLFGVDPGHATKVELGQAAGNADVTLWLGKQGDDPGANFVRAEGNDAVRHVREGLRSDLGLFGAMTSPRADQWVQKLVLDRAPADLTTVAIDRADVRYVFEQEEGAAPPPAPQPGQNEPPKPPSTWKLVSPALPWTVRGDALEGVVSRMAKLRVSNVLDTATTSCAITAPSATVTFTRKAGGFDVVKLGEKLPDKDDVVVKVNDGPQCFSLASWSLQSLLPRAASLWEVPPAFEGVAPSAEAKRVSIDMPGAKVTLVAAGENKWTMESPTKGPANAGRVSRVVSALKNLRFDEVAEASRIPAAALQPEATVTADFGGKPLTLRVLGARVGSATGEHYVRVQGASLPDGWVGILAKSTVDSLLPKLDELKETGSS